MTTAAARIIPVQVKSDFLQEVQKVSPQLALQELIWNSLDADADEVRVSFDLSPLGGIQGIRVTDNGTGIEYEAVAGVFGSLGGSWKRETRKSRNKGRLLHGAAGRGRFRAFRLGQRIEWRSCYANGLLTEEFMIWGDSPSLENLYCSERTPSTSAPGIVVTISDVTTNLVSLLGDQAREGMTQQFAPYLANYPEVTIWIDGIALDPAAAIKENVDLSAEIVTLKDGTEAKVAVSIFEWKAATKRTFVLCDEEGFPRHELSSHMHTQGYDFTAYIKSSAFRQLDEANALPLEEMDPDIQALIEAAREKVREHFRVKTAQASVQIVERWQQEHVYPYRGVPQSPVETAERQVFDVLALSLETYLPGFRKATPKEKEFSLRLLRKSVENGPEEVVTIMREVMDLPAEQQAELNRLLQKTTLSAVIKAAKVVADRQDFLKGLQILLFEADVKDKLLERKQLHKILERETWIFGEEYNLTNSDQNLDKVLAKHLELLGPRQNAPPVAPGPVAIDGQTRGIIDLMLSRKVAKTNPSEREHLIVELKRPTQKIDSDVLNQVKKYAMAVADDERFIDTGTQWTFWALSNEVSPNVKKEVSQTNRAYGIAYQNDNITVWVKPWSQVIEDCLSRLAFYEKELQYKANDSSALEYLTKVHEKHLPAALRPVIAPPPASVPPVALVPSSIP